jgi:hypothetical protein
MTATKENLKAWVVEALRARGGRAHLVDVAKHIWKHHRTDLEDSGDLFYRWQYDMRWAANILRNEGVLLGVEDLPRGYWGMK